MLGEFQKLETLPSIIIQRHARIMANLGTSKVTPVGDDFVTLEQQQQLCAATPNVDYGIRN